MHGKNSYSFQGKTTNYVAYMIKCVQKTLHFMHGAIVIPKNQTRSLCDKAFERNQQKSAPKVACKNCVTKFNLRKQINILIHVNCKKI